ncbi:hypothetical protein M427DRAFT_153956 [Gonapodya prolifera JEL478]|uniref:Uncharacterized protein n=1 Tax=Gonapodya prolifera (strain JEL478) TaxID=1344416 RepID=A0A139AK29_GONPJ|nr:hypothetical protein M427DRAFT_153956 [Gonapodya prolifera JEL478]|eukprot:KXS17129.1 hypothetical protein M427DRAFT_153956 [Gonapodya prolifera JEL478]
MNIIRTLSADLRHAIDQRVQYRELRRCFPQIVVASARARARQAWTDLTLQNPLIHPNGTKVYLVGAGHFLRESGERVLEIMREVKPDGLAMELDPGRWARLDMIRRHHGRIPWYEMSAFNRQYRKIFRRTNYLPASEYIWARDVADEVGTSQLCLMDMEMEDLIVPTMMAEAGTEDVRRYLIGAGADSSYVLWPIARGANDYAHFRTKMTDRWSRISTYLKAVCTKYSLPLPGEVPIAREGAIRRMELESRKRLRDSFQFSRGSVEECEMELGFPQIVATGHVPTLLWEDVRTPRILEKERLIQRDALPEYHYWGLGLRDAIMTEYLWDFCEVLGSRALESIRGDFQSGIEQTTGNVSIPSVDQGRTLVAIMGKSHIFGVTRFWGQASGMEGTSSVLTSHQQMRRYRYFYLENGFQRLADIAE